MQLKNLIVILIISLSSNIGAQEKYKILGSFKNQTFNDFVEKAESTLHVKFFYKDEWVNELKLDDYPNCTNLTCLLDNLFKGTTLYYFIEESGNIVITNKYAVRISAEAEETDFSLAPSIDNSFVDNPFVFYPPLSSKKIAQPPQI